MNRFSQNLIAVATVCALLAVLGVGGCWSRQICCQYDDECAEAYACVAGICRARCQLDEQCQLGQTCDLELSVCLGGATPSHCIASLDADSARDAHTDTNLAEDAGAEDHVSNDHADFDLNGLDRFYVDRVPNDVLHDSTLSDSAFVDRPPSEAGIDANGACGFDPYEPNDDLNQAAPLASNSNVQASICNVDVDIYRVTLVAGEGTVFTMRTQVTAAASLILYAPNGRTVIAQTDSDQLERSLFVRADVTGRYYLKLLGSCAASCDYTLQVQASSCADDIYEDNDGFGRAAYVSPGLVEAMLCRADDDYYSFDLSQQSFLNLDLRFANASGDLELALFGPDRTRVGLSQGVGDAEVIALPIVQPGRYTARVFGFGVVVENSYSLDVCPDDGFEPNNAFEQASVQSLGMLHARLCRFNDDYYVFNVDADAQVSFSLQVDPAAGTSVEWTIIAAGSSEILASGESSSAVTTISVSAPTSGGVVVRLHASQSVDYTLVMAQQ